MLRLLPRWLKPEPMLADVLREFGRHNPPTVAPGTRSGAHAAPTFKVTSSTGPTSAEQTRGATEQEVV